jgi:transcriptional regulator with XRE-family HTH domain
MPTTHPRSTAGDDLRASRLRLGITRAQLAGLADCSYATLSQIEQGAIPRKSAVLQRAQQALATLAAEQGRDR